MRFLTGSSADSEDIVHQAFLLGHSHLASAGDFHGDAGKWLRGSARNLVRAWWRNRRRLPQDLADQLACLAEEDAAGTDPSDDMMTALDECLEKLGPDDRGLLARRYEHGLRLGAIAAQMRLNIVTLRVRLFRLRQALKGCVETVLSRGGHA